VHIHASGTGLYVRHHGLCMRLSYILCTPGDAVSPNRSLATHAAKDSPIPDTRRRGPYVECGLYPVGNRDGTDMPSFAHQIDQRPMLLPLLHVTNLKLGHFCSTEAAAEQNGENGPVSATLQRLSVGCLQ
jgi:hypothetical protein